MFMKVYQYPPRRGNGSYWTLLSDGEEELKKAVPLFATLQPPVIDANCAYHREPSTYTVKSKGRFIPVLPRSDVGTANLPYFSLGSNVASGLHICSNINALGTEVEMDDFPETVCQFLPSCEDVDGEDKEEETASYLEQPFKKPKHLHDHSYAKGLFQEVDDFIEEAIEAEVIELAAGVRDEGTGNQDDSFSTPLALKQKKKLPKEKRYLQQIESRQHPSLDVAASLRDSPPFGTPTKEQDNSLHLLDSSLLTPLKSLVPDVELGAISFSPLYSNLTPKHKVSSQVARQLTSSDAQFQPYLPSPFTPLKGAFDSGIFSPLRTDSLGGIKFSTPTNISPLGDLNSFNSLQSELCPLKVLDSSAGSTPMRPGSLRAFGLPGLTPPTAR